jgi:hypothetical protein
VRTKKLHYTDRSRELDDPLRSSGDGTMAGTNVVSHG